MEKTKRGEVKERKISKSDKPNKWIFIAIIPLIILFFAILAIALEEYNESMKNETIVIVKNPDFLKQGKNYVVFENQPGLYASELISYNPYVESVSYYDVSQEKTIGYVNVFGGIGKNFILREGIVYEINSKEDIGFVLP